MSSALQQWRYWLELLALPFFVFLVLEITSEAVVSLVSGEEHGDEGHAMALMEPNIALVSLLVAVGLVALWQLPALKELVPCHHLTCRHRASPILHMLAIVALVLHFFPEASLRAELMNEALASPTDVALVLAFGTHLIIDVLVAILMSQYWQKRSSRLLSLTFIASVWLLSYWTAERVDLHFLESGYMLLLTAFLLAMFIHLPHKRNLESEHHHHDDHQGHDH